MIWPPSFWHPMVWLWLLGAACFAGLIAKTWQRDVPGAAIFRTLALANVIYAGTTALELVVTDPRHWWWVTGVMHVGIGLIGPCVALLLADVGGQNHWFTRRRRWLLLGGGMALGALRFADPWLCWMYRHYDDVSQGKGYILHRFDPGPAFFVLQGCLLAGMIAGLFFCWKAWPEAGRLLRRHLVLLASACMVPVVVSTLFAFGLTPWGSLDPTPGAALGALAIASWSMFRERLVGVTPIARNFLIEHLGDGVLVADSMRTVVDYNPAAQRFLALSDSKSLGRPLEEIVSRWPGLPGLCGGSQTATTEIRPFADQDSHWSVTWYPLTHHDDRQSHGYMLILSDITARKRTEQQLRVLLETRTEEWQRATRAALRATEEEQTRLGQILHDTLCQDLIGYRRIVEGVVEKAQPGPDTQRLRILSNDLAEANRRARELAHLLEGPDLVHNTFEDALDATVLHLEKTFGVTCEVTIDPAFPVLDREQGRHLLRIIREAISNGARHGKAKHIWVDLLARSRHLTVSVANDGLPPPPPEKLTEGLGSRQMKMRTSLLGGKLTLRPGSDGGAILELQLPPLDPLS